MPPPTQEVGKGLPALEVPVVAAKKVRWRAQIDKLCKLKGANTPLLTRVRRWVDKGVKAEFEHGPPPQRAMANTSTFDRHHGECMERMRVYQDLQSLALLSSPPPPGGHVQPLHAVIKAGKKARICVDLSRNFNKFLRDESFTMASVQDAVTLAQRAGPSPYFVKLDLSSCFLSFPIHPDDLQYFYCEAGGDYYQFLTLVFGRKDAPRVVSALLDVVSSALVDAGIEHVRYLDDFWLVATSERRAWLCAHRAATIIAEFGLALSLPKVEGPSRRLEFLGIIIDSITETLSISSSRKEELLGLLTAFSKRRKSSVTRLQSLLGKLSFAATVLPGARPFLRRIIDRIAGHRSGDLLLGPAFKADVRYWLHHLSQWNGRARWRVRSGDPWVFASDASTSGFAYGLEQCTPTNLATLDRDFAPGAVRSGSWSAANGDARRQCDSAAIQWGELFCPLAAAVEFGPRLANSHVVFVIDNESDVFIINRQRTREQRLALLLRALSTVSLEFNFSYEAVHRSGTSNVLMDWASRPALHRFTAQMPLLRLPPLPPAALVEGEGGVGLTRDSHAYPPLLHPISLTYINSGCLQFTTSGDAARWPTTTGGW